MSKTIKYYFYKKHTISYHIFHSLIIFIIWFGFFSYFKEVKAQSNQFAIINTQYTSQNTANYKTNIITWSLFFSQSWYLSFFDRSWNGVTSIFYDEWSSKKTIYFQNFDTPDVLELNQVPLADSIRDFTGGTNWKGQNWWKYLYTTESTWWYTDITESFFQDNYWNLCDTWDIWTTISWNFTILDVYWYSWTTLYATEWMTGNNMIGSPIDLWFPRTCSLIMSSYLCSRPATFVTEHNLVQNSLNSKWSKNLFFSNSTKLRTIGWDNILNHNFANIGKKYAHPWSGTTNSLLELSWLNNIPIIRQRTSNLTGTIKIINTLSDDENNCGNWIIYRIYTWEMYYSLISGINQITGVELPNLFNNISIEQDIDVNFWDNIFFEIDNSGDNQCDGTRNRIQIYDITTNTGINWWPTYTDLGKYNWALEFSGNQVFSLGSWINQSTNGITIWTWVYTRDNTKKQWIVTKDDSYGIVVKSGTVRVSPSTYWMRHDTWIPIAKDTRTHLTWTYDWTTMHLYKNGWSQNPWGQTRSYNIAGTLLWNDNLTYIGYDERNQRWRDGYIDELRMYNIWFTGWQVQELYESNLRRISSWDNAWEFVISKKWLDDWLYDYKYIIPNDSFPDEWFPKTLIYTGWIIYDSIWEFLSIPVCSPSCWRTCDIWITTSRWYYYLNNYICRAPDADAFIPWSNGYQAYILGNTITWSVLIDTQPPFLTWPVLGLTGEEADILTVTWIWFDTGISQDWWSWYLTTGFDRWYGRDIYGNRDIATNTGNTMNFSIQDLGQFLTPERYIKVRIEDHLGNIGYRTGTIRRENAGPPIFSGFVIWTWTSTTITWEENNNITLQRTGYDPNLNIQTGFDWLVVVDGQTYSYDNTWNTILIPAQDEPISWIIEVVARDSIGYNTSSTGIIERTNTPPIIPTTIQSYYTGIVEDNITFYASGFDTGSTLAYQWYNWTGCNSGDIITWATESVYTWFSNFNITWHFSYLILDQQWLWKCRNILGERKFPSENTSTIIWNRWRLLNWNSTWREDITWSIIYPWSIWTCSSDNENTYYTGVGIGNDYCIINNTNSWYIVLGWYGVNRYDSLFSMTWTKINPYLIGGTNPPYIIEIQNTNLTWFDRSISGTNNTTYTNNSIYNSWLIWLYNFDKILLTDSSLDFSPIQSWKNWSYWRRKKWYTDYEQLQYYAPSQQRLINNPLQDYDNLFIEKDELNPWYAYGDVVLWWTSPVNATIEIQYTLSDANTTCGDGISYKLIKNTDTILKTGSFETYTKTTKIFSWDTIYLVVSSNTNNECDNTDYNIKIYQLPESNLWTKWIYQWSKDINLTEYISGKYYGAYNFDENSIDLWTGIHWNNMSIASWIYKWSGNKQTFIQKWWSYGISIYNNTLQVTNLNTTKRYNTSINIPDNTRTHIGRSYDGITMKVYINGEEKRSTTVIGTIPNNNNSTYIGRSFSNWYRSWSIDELYIYNYAVSSGVFATLYNHNLNKIARDKRHRSSNQSWWVYNGHFDFIGTINWDAIVTWEIMRDFTTPLFTEFIGLTGYESSNLLVTWFGYDSGSYISWYQFRYKINIGTWDWTEWTDISTGNSITISWQDEPTTGEIEIKITDLFGYQIIGSWIIEWINTWPIINWLSSFNWLVNQNITFIASGYDIWWDPLSYQWYFNYHCNSGNIISGATNNTFITGSSISGDFTFSYQIFDRQWSGSCKNILWKRNDDSGFFENYYLHLTWWWTWWIISGNLWQAGINIIENAKYGICILTGSNESRTTKKFINYQPYTGSNENDHCIVQVSDGNYLIVTFTNVNNNFIYYRLPNLIDINKDIRNILWTGYINIWDISSFEGNRWGIISQTWWTTWILNNTWRNIYNDNLIRKYSFDKIKIADSSDNFGYYQWEYWRKYKRDNWSVNGELVFNPISRSRIINEPIQDYEHMFVSSTKAYPWSTKYGKIIYERTSNSTGNIDIETFISNANPNSCPNSDGIIYTILTWSTELDRFTSSDTRLISNRIYTTGINTQIWDKFYFIIDPRQNNQCDEINIDIEIYKNTTNDLSSSWQHLENNWVSLTNGKYYGAYNFGSTTGQYINIWTIDIRKNLSFIWWFKIDSTNDQTLIYKQWSYGLAIKDNTLKITTDWWRRYSTNTNTTDILTNNSRNQLARTYNGTNMYIYINWIETRSGRIVWYYPDNGNTTSIWRSQDHGQLIWSIDELQVRNKTLTQKNIQQLYTTQLSKLSPKIWEFTFAQTWLLDGSYIFTGDINGNFITGTTIIDNDPPFISVANLYTGNEWEDIYITVTWRDNGIGVISGYNYSRTINNSRPSNLATGMTGWITGSTITIPAQNEPTTGTLTIQIKDSLWHTTWTTTIIQWLNIAPTTYNILFTGYETENITFIASGFDPNGTSSTWYQWYNWSDCTDIITGAISKTYTTGTNEAYTGIYSYIIKDKQWLTGNCSIATGIWYNIEPIAEDLYINANGNVNITFTGKSNDTWWTIFTYQWYNDSWCWSSIPGATSITFTTGSEIALTKAFSYQARDAQWLAATNINDTWRNCQIATGYRPHINPIAHDFDISTNTAKNVVTGDRRELSEARDSEFNTKINATLSNQSWWICRLINDRISFQPNIDTSWTWFCQFKLTDNNNGVTYVKWFAKNIDTQIPTTSIIINTWTSTNFKLNYKDTSTGTTYYKILTWLREAWSCWTTNYTIYNSGSQINIIFTTGINDYKTVCFYSKDIHNNIEQPKTNIFNQNTAELIVSVTTPEFIKDTLTTKIIVNKACTWILTGLDNPISLNFSWAGTYTITWNISATEGQKNIYISLQTDDITEWVFSWTYSFVIDQQTPSIPIITETNQNNLYYSITWNPSIDTIAWIKWYEYKVNNQYNTIIKSGFTDANFVNINKSEVNNNNQISIYIQSIDFVDNISARSNPAIFTITQNQQTENEDITPDQFYFSKTTNAKLEREYTSNEIVIWWLSENTEIPLYLINSDDATLYINDTEVDNNSWWVKNNDIVYVKLLSSDNYNDSTQTTVVANNISSTYTITTESKTTTSSTTSFLDQIKKLLEELQDNESEDSTTSSGTGDIDTKWFSAPYTAPNGKVYNLFKTTTDKYSSYNFIYKKYFDTLQEMKAYIDKNNPR